MKLHIEKLDNIEAPMSGAWWLGFVGVAGCAVLIHFIYQARKKK